MNYRLLSILLLAFNLTAVANERYEEVKENMWTSASGAFTNVNLPDKWKDKSAVILARLNRFEYHKPVLIKELRTKSTFHIRIKLNDKSAINEYSERSFPSERKNMDVHVGFKVIKADGREVIVDHNEAVEMEMTEGRNRHAYKKLAIPELEPGDILDYFICQEETLPLSSNMYYFDPVQYHLPDEYPVMEQCLEFKVQRRCFISINSSNGAPELEKIVDDENEIITYTLIDKDREDVKELRWFYPYRELPTIKFRAAYASGKAIRKNDVLLGEPGVAKNSVKEDELADYLTYLLVNTYTDPKQMMKYVKKNLPKNASNFEKVKAAFYFRRNQELSWDEVRTIADKDTWNQSMAMYKDNRLQSLDRFSVFLASMDIPHDIVMAIPRDVAALNDLILEHELSFLLRVREGDEFLYLSPVDNFRLPGEIDIDLMGVEAYIVDGNANFSDWKLEKIELPTVRKHENGETSQLMVTISDNMKKTKVDVNACLNGSQKNYAQHSLLDIYDYKKEESERYEMKENFEGTLWMKKKLLTLRDSYLKNRDTYRSEALKTITDNNYSFEVDTVYDFQLLQSGRFDTMPEMKYRYTFETTELVKKAGRNYMIDVGKLIQNQVRIEKDELERSHGIYMYSPRSFNYTINIQIPEGYSIQGLEKLNGQVENEQGSFVSSAKQEGEMVRITTQKCYNNLYDKAETWSNYVAFLNAAANFSEAKLLLRKK